MQSSTLVPFQWNSTCFNSNLAWRHMSALTNITSHVQKFWFTFQHSSTRGQSPAVGSKLACLKLACCPVAAVSLWQVSNEVKAARSLPNCSCLGHQVAWKDAPDGSMMCVSLYAGRTVEALLQEPATKGGWSDLNLQQRLEVAREVLAGGLHALSKLRPWVS